MRIRSEYSSKLAHGKLANVHNRVLQLGWNTAPISDRMSTYSFASWQELCDKVNIKPIFGVEIGVSSQIGQKRPAISYWTFFAINNLRSINELIFKATSRSYPLLSDEEAMEANDVIKIADNKISIRDSKNSSGVYIALSPSIPIGLFRMGKEKGFNFIASSDNAFTCIQDKMAYHTLLYKDAETASYPQWILTDDEWRVALPYIITDADAKLAIQNRNEVMGMCNAKLLKAETFIPKESYDLMQMCFDGAEKLNIDLDSDDYKYAARLETELDLIHRKGFNDYFYIVADLVSFAKQHMIVGPARGSAAGSLVSYLLGITTIDPIKFNLLFERFIDITRADLPDIDLDFSNTKRHLTFDYLKEKYGAEHVAHLGTTLKFKAKSIMNRAGASLGIPKWMSDQVADTLIERSSADSRAQQSSEESFHDTEIGKRLITEFPEISTVFDTEDHISHYGTHAAGVAITEGNVLDYVAIDNRNGTIIADKFDREKLNILKIDVLGLSQLSVFERCLELIGKEPKNGFLESLPLDDQLAFNVLNKKQFSGIFQANGKSLQILFSMIHADRIDDLIAITSLSRPPPVASGGAVRWTRKRSSKETVTYLHPSLEPYLKETYGEIIYQEQVMAICRDIGKMGFADITKIRKAMSKSLGVTEMNKLGEPFKVGAKDLLGEEITEKLFGQMIQFGAWAFNKSHAVSYGLITYYCCWLKAHYPVEFAAATLDSEHDPMKQLFMLRELALEGIDYKPIDIEYSTDKWSIKEENGKKILVGPLTNIKGIGPVTVQKIFESRRPGGKALTPGIMSKLENAITDIDSLTPIRDAVKKLHPDLTSMNIYSVPVHINFLQSGMQGEFMIFALVKRIQPRDLNDLQSVAKRGYKINGQSWVLRLFVHDDTDEILCQIDRHDYLTVGKKIEEIGGQGDALYAIKGTIPATFRMIKITGIRYLGKISDTVKPVIKNDLFGPVAPQKQFLIQVPEVANDGE